MVVHCWFSEEKLETVAYRWFNDEKLNAIIHLLVLLGAAVHKWLEARMDAVATVGVI